MNSQKLKSEDKYCLIFYAGDWECIEFDDIYDCLDVYMNLFQASKYAMICIQAFNKKTGKYRCLNYVDL